MALLRLLLITTCATLMFVSDTNADTNTCNSCSLVRRYGCQWETDCCFYFAEKSSCSGCCSSKIDLDPVSFLAKQVNQSCCAPVAKRHMKTQLWCHGEADTANKHVDPRFPGWYYTEHFRYTIATECACVRNNWQDNVVCDGSLENDDFSRQTAEGGSGDVDHLEINKKKRLLFRRLLKRLNNQSNTSYKSVWENYLWQYRSRQMLK